MVDKQILLIDDDLTVLKTSQKLLEREGFEGVITCSNAIEVLPLLKSKSVQTVVLDLGMPGVSGLELLDQLIQGYPHVPVIVGTGEKSMETALECIKKGAMDYMVKPFAKERLITCVKNAIELHALNEDRDGLQRSMQTSALKNPEAFEGIVTQNDRMLQIFSYLEALSQTSQPALIYGETGVGKELIAQAIHNVSKRKGEFVAINLAGIDDTVFSDTLFGHVKGAFTGAQGTRVGMIAKAASGTLFLDEIGDLSPQSQIKLLRFLQEKEYFPVGSDKALYSNARVIAATHQDLHALCEQGHFREDLLFRLKTHHITVPPLRKRKDDLPLLVEKFLTDFCHEIDCAMPTFSLDLARLLSHYDFPGNIRELKAILFDLVTNHLSRSEGFAAVLLSLQTKLNLDFREQIDTPVTGPIRFGEILPSIKEATRMLVDEAMLRCDGNQTKAARMLGITQQSLSERVRKYKKHEESNS